MSTEMFKTDEYIIKAAEEFQPIDGIVKFTYQVPNNPSLMERLRNALGLGVGKAADLIPEEKGRLATILRANGQLSDAEVAFLHGRIVKK